VLPADAEMSCVLTVTETVPSAGKLSEIGMSSTPPSPTEALPIATLFTPAAACAGVANGTVVRNAAAMSEHAAAANTRRECA